MAKIDVIMPQMGESIAEGTLSRWMKKVGDPVKRDEPIFEISTDKVDAEIPAPAAGVLAEILVQEGQTVAVQTVVARIETDASAGAAAKPRRTRRAPARRHPRRNAPAPEPPRRRRAAPRRRRRPCPARRLPRRPPAPAPPAPPARAADAGGNGASETRRGAAAAASPRRWSARWPPSTTSTSARSRAPGSRAGSPRTTC